MRTLSLFFLIICAFRLSAQVAEKPYIILIEMDDLNTYIQGYPAFPQATTPNLYAMEQNGTVFTNVHCVSPKCAPSRTSMLTGKDVTYTQVYDNTTYKCNDFRKNFNVIKGNEEVFTLPEYLKDSCGYYTYNIGKILHCYENYSDFDDATADACARQYSWNDEFVYVEDDIIDPIGDAENDGLYLLKWAHLNDTILPYMEDDVSVDQAIDFLQAFATEGTAITCGDPFFLALGIKKPHAPFYVPESFFSADYLDDFFADPYNKPYNDPYNAYPYNGLVMPPQPEPRWADYDSLGYMGKLFASTNEENQFAAYGDGLAVLPEIDPDLTDSERVQILNESQRANAILAYLAGVNLLDYELGRFFTELQSHPDIYNNCVIIITSDHGFSLGTKKHWGKYSMWEPDMQIPFIYIDMRDPVYQVCDKSVSHLDLFPTVLDMLDVPEPTFADGSRYLDGYSILPLVNNPNLHWERPALGTIRVKEAGGVLQEGSCFSQFSVRTNRFHLIRYATNNIPPDLECNEALSQLEYELYDVGEHRETDPNEWNNLWDDPEYAPVMQYLLQFLPDSSMYNRRAFSVDINAVNALPCMLPNNAKIKLKANLYDTTGVALGGAGYTFIWTNSLTGAISYGKTYAFNMLTVPPAVFSAQDHIMFYLDVIDNVSGARVAFNTRTFYINTANTPNATYTLLNDVPSLSTTVTDYTISGTYASTSWNFGDGTVLNNDLIPDTHHYAAAGVYPVKNYIAFGNGCSRVIKHNAILMREGEPEMQWTVYPNPASTDLHILFREHLTDATITVVNIMGQQCASEHIAGVLNDYTLDISALPAGTYLLEVRSGIHLLHKIFEVAR
ncbi:MAG: sulfatase-like hydrolase/transferase [Chitinophagales bacterium]